MTILPQPGERVGIWANFVKNAQNDAGQRLLPCWRIA